VNKRENETVLSNHTVFNPGYLRDDDKTEELPSHVCLRLPHRVVAGYGHEYCCRYVIIMNNNTSVILYSTTSIAVGGVFKM